MKKTLLAVAVCIPLAVGAQTKKVLIEDFTGIWCQHCPKGTVILDGLETQYPATVIPVASHNDGGYGPQYDVLMITEGKAAAAGLAVSSFPAGAIDRKLFAGETKIPLTRSKWAGYAAQRVAEPAIVSISFANTHEVSAGNFEADVKVKFTSAPAAGTPLRLQVYLLENKIKADLASLKQSNASDGPNGGASPLTTAAHGFYHNNTLRAALGGTWGFNDVIPSTVEVGKEYTKHISFALATTGTVPDGGWVRNEMNLVAFVAYDGAATADKKEILNAEELSLKAFFPTSINNINKQVNIINAFPNPAGINDLVKLEYTMMESGFVTLSIYNGLGQLVAKPYHSNEVSGAHTIPFRASDYNLASGTYILQLSTPSGNVSEKITIQ